MPSDPRGNNIYRVVRYEEHSQAISGGSGPSSGGLSVADPRPGWNGRYSALEVTDWNDHANTVIAGGKGVQGGWLSVADPRISKSKEHGDAYLTNGHYGVVGWEDATGAVSAAASIDNGRWSVADPRMPAANDKVVALIRSFDGTWHRPFTTLELAALQSLVDPDDIFDLDGDSDGQKRERIGNAVPAAAAQAIADLMGHTLLLAWSGETFALSATPIWVRPVAVALSVKQPEGL
jgi:site-specific DNA-cytosine methylase